MFRALLAHPQDSQHKQHLVYCVRVMSVGCNRIGVEPVPLQSWCSSTLELNAITQNSELLTKEVVNLRAL
jgi:hypothetical protein